jgi:hypothetical protein
VPRWCRARKPGSLCVARRYNTALNACVYTASRPSCCAPDGTGSYAVGQLQWSDQLRVQLPGLRLLHGCVSIGCCCRAVSCMVWRCTRLPNTTVAAAGDRPAWPAHHAPMNQLDDCHESHLVTAVQQHASMLEAVTTTAAGHPVHAQDLWLPTHPQQQKQHKQEFNQPLQHATGVETRPSDSSRQSSSRPTQHGRMCTTAAAAAGARASSRARVGGCVASLVDAHGSRCLRHAHHLLLRNSNSAGQEHLAWAHSTSAECSTLPAGPASTNLGLVQHT